MTDLTVFEICNKLVAEQKEPNVALIKSRLSKKLPLPQIISELQQWKRNPKSTPELTIQPAIKLTLEQRVETLERQVSELQNTIQSLLSSDR